MIFWSIGVNNLWIKSHCRCSPVMQSWLASSVFSFCLSTFVLVHHQLTVGQRTCASWSNNNWLHFKWDLGVVRSRGSAVKGLCSLFFATSRLLSEVAWEHLLLSSSFGRPVLPFHELKVNESRRLLCDCSVFEDGRLGQDTVWYQPQFHFGSVLKF